MQHRMVETKERRKAHREEIYNRMSRIQESKSLSVVEQPCELMTKTENFIFVCFIIIQFSCQIDT